MFTGLVVMVGQITAVQDLPTGGRHFAVHAPAFTAELKVGDSVAISGACHTVVAVTTDSFWIESVPETLTRTNLGDLKIHDAVNLELPLRPTDRLGGHFVTGHIDALATILQIAPRGNSQEFTLRVPNEFAKLIVTKGSVALDGISLTVASAAADTFIVAIIPHTLAATTLGTRQVGDRLNFEADLLAKHVTKLLNA